MVYATLKFVQVEIDGDDERNRNPRQNIPEGELEDIEVLKLNVRTLLKDLEELGGQGFMIQSMLYSYALGLQQASSS